MRHFTSVHDVADTDELIQLGLHYKADPCVDVQLGVCKTLGLLFFNSSLRTRMSTQKAALNLGMDVMIMNVSQDSWQLEFGDQVIMNGNKAEHIKEAAPVLGQYCDVIGVRSFPTLSDRDYDSQEVVINSFVQYSGVPIISLESATLHPLQSLADMMTIEELKSSKNPKIVLTWAPHIKPLPQAVANSFSQWCIKQGHDLTITHPEGFELPKKFTDSAKIVYHQQDALKDADFIYVKNWSSYKDYGKVGDFPDWMIDTEKWKTTNQAKVMHCLPVRRNVVISDEVLEGEQSVVIQQAANRVYSAQAVLSQILKELS